MKAVVITRLGGPEVLEIRDVPDATPSSGEELVHVEVAGVNFADTMTAHGGYPGTPKPPLVAGREFCGTRASDGERVMGYAQWGAFAEAVAARSALLWPVPAGSCRTCCTSTSRHWKSIAALMRPVRRNNPTIAG